MIKKFVFVGPESSGKTTLCKMLSEKYKTLWVQEYCRVVAEEKKPDTNSQEINFNFTLDDFINMAHRQNEEEYEYSKKVNKILICDNDTFALTIWCERYLNQYYNEIYDIYKNADYLHNENKIYILTKPNVAFVQDGFRDGEHIRDWMYLRFIEELEFKKMNYFIIDSPDYEERFQKAIHIINENIN
jgi:HTH-type transcriptional repressor of NAD biosynthesis genes